MARSRMSYAYAAAVGLAAMAASFTPAQAQTSTVNGVTFPIGIVPGGGVFESGILLESQITGSSQTLMGVGRVDTINTPGGTVVWQNGQNGVELAFTFDKYVSNVVTPPSPTGAGTVTFQGGTLTFYTLAAGTNINDSTKTIAQNMATVSSGTLFLAYTAALEDAAADTLIATIPANQTLANFANGSGFGFLDVVKGALGGPASGAFDTNTFADAFDTANGGNADASFTSAFSAQNGSGAFPITGSGTIKANAIPEPASLAVLGIGLLGLGLARRRRS